MKITIQNEELAFTALTLGAEGRSLCDVKTGKEYFWKADPAYWGGCAPILFPATGGCWNSTYRIDNQEYSMPKHGFVKKQEWKVETQTPTSITFSYEPTPEELSFFPFPCQVFVTYRLEGRTLFADFEVKNLGETTMYFQMGGHPGFELEDFTPDNNISGYLKLEGNPQSLLRATEQGCTEPMRFPVPFNEEGLVPLCMETFVNEALILDGNQIHAATLLRLDKTPVARVESSAPVWLFWAPQGVHAPFVCAEPWYGLCDPIGFEGPVTERPFINSLSAHQSWKGGYTVEIY